MRDAARALLRGPAGKVLAVALLFRLTGLVWGLPASDGWDDDGVAPRDFLAGVLETYWWGHHATYPPLQMLLLTIETAPVWILTLLRSPSLAPDTLVRAFIQVPTMTAFAVIARATTIAMSLGLLWNVARIGEDLRGSPRAGGWTAASCAACAVLTYYSQTSNLDVPYLFWSVLSTRWLVHAIVHHEPAALRRVIVFAALATCTKDQACALFLLGLPLALVLWPIVDPRARSTTAPILKNVAMGATAGLAVVLVVDGAVFNPMGAVRRVQFLLGTASQDHAMYARSLPGLLHVLRDGALAFDHFYPWVFVLLAAFGCVAAWRSPDPARRAAGTVPWLMAVSFTVAFNLAARRTEDRFLLPQMLMCGIYAGLGCDALHAALGRQRTARRWALAVVFVPAFALAVYHCAAVDVAMALDPRYDAERWMREHAEPGDRIEVYDNNVHLPRLPPDVQVDRVDGTEVAERNPLPGVTEVRDRFSNVEARQPRWIVLSEFWASKYLLEPEVLTALGRTLSPQQAAMQQDGDSNAYFRALCSGQRGYRLAHRASRPSTVWPRQDIHASLDREIWIYERR